MTIKIPLEKYPIEPVRKALKSNGFRYSKKESCFIWKISCVLKVFALGICKNIILVKNTKGDEWHGSCRNSMQMQRLHLLQWQWERKGFL